MEVKQIIRILGVVALLGGIARICMAPSAYIWGADSMPELVSGFVACVLMGIGIIGVYLYQAPRSGLLGLISVLLLSVSSSLTAALVWNNMLGLLPEDHNYISMLLPINSILTLIGQIVFSLTAIRARVYPIWSLILFIVYPGIYFIPAVSDLGSVAWGLCYVVFALYILQVRARRA
ncbi:MULTISPECIES: hypothetical protein [Paenibacillus]|jgi:hypothetical protein|uniref:Uncharacterized protein n=1 Tax=Paenibacillus oceani TaxID=2772510 RepID=A0A927CD60_9BACL|nr:hypothetical protein [Paenibacillus oceani]MBD2865889.1 hypothetical protein [Paenibacillus oceani]